MEMRKNKTSRGRREIRNDNAQVDTQQTEKEPDDDKRHTSPMFLLPSPATVTHQPHLFQFFTAAVTDVLDDHVASLDNCEQHRRLGIHRLAKKL